MTKNGYDHDKADQSVDSVTRHHADSEMEKTQQPSSLYSRKFFIDDFLTTSIKRKQRRYDDSEFFGLGKHSRPHIMRGSRIYHF